MHESVAAIAATGVSPLVRIAANQGWMVKLPLLNTVEDAKALVKSAKFPPSGQRGFGSPFAMERFGDISQTEYLQQANESLLTIVQIETRDALHNVDAIAKVSGIDVLFCGPFDLGNNIGHPILDGTMHDELKEAIAKIQRVAKDNKKASGIYATSGDQARQYADQGFNMVSVATDAALLPADDTPAPELRAKNPISEDFGPPPKPIAISNGGTEAKPAPLLPQAPQDTVKATPPPPESDSDDPLLPIPPNKTCRRRGCTVNSSKYERSPSRDDEKCIYHPGQPIFHEGSKGWSCCKRRVLEFDEFMKIEGCKRKKRHMFVGSGKKDGKEEALSTVRHDFYQTPTTVIASFFLKKIDKERAKIDFSSQSEVLLDLPTADNKRYKTNVPLFGQIDATKSTSKIMGTKLELTLAKLDGASWPTLRSDETRTNEITQIGPAGRA
ncbi:MAG: hypothetical protein Q9212_006549 [Teloschistes hypoglaucus]